MIALVCVAQVLVQIGAFFWPALLPGMMTRWSLTNSEAGWITAAFYGAYIAAVPVLVTLTDRIDAKRVYLFGVTLMVAGHALFALLADGFWSALLARALTGMGWAGTYMTGLKVLADRVDGKLLSRAAAGPCGEHRRIGCAVVRLCRPARRCGGLAAGIRGSCRERGTRMGADRLRDTPWRAHGGCAADPARSISVRYCAIARPWPMRSRMASTPSR